MEELEAIWGNRKITHRVLLLVGECGLERIEEFFLHTNVEECCVMCSWPTHDIEILKEQILNDAAREKLSIPPKIYFITYHEFHGWEKEWGLCVLKSMTSDILPLLSYKPQYLVGSVIEDSVSTFSIWELCRTFCKEVFIKTFREGKAPIVLEWNEKKEDKIELSIILPVYNVGKYIENCLASVTAWKADYVEFLLVSDGSRDESVSIIKKWMEQDNRIHLIEKENGGCASARQAGLEVARGRYIGFVDPDDFVDHNMFHRLLKAAMSGSYDISLCGYNEYYESSGRIRQAEDYLCYPYLDGCFDPIKVHELITYCRVAIWRGIYRRKFLEQHNIGFYTDIKRYDDLPFKVETFAFAKSVTILNEHLYYYRLGREGQDVAADDERLYVHFDIFEHLNQSIGATGDQRLIDNLQMCKIQTHRYALSKIQDKYKKEYMNCAKEDLNALCDFDRTYKIATMMLGKKVADDYKKIVLA